MRSYIEKDCFEKSQYCSIGGRTEYYLEDHVSTKTDMSFTNQHPQ
jgi:hypothetical protein